MVIKETELERKFREQAHSEKLDEVKRLGYKSIEDYIHALKHPDILKGLR